MDDITKALYSNHLNIIRNEAEEVQEYDVVNEQDIKELIGMPLIGLHLLIRKILFVILCIGLLDEISLFFVSYRHQKLFFYL